MRYSEGFKASIVKKTQDGSGRSVYQIAGETGINPVTIKNWIIQFKHGTLGKDGSDTVTPSQRNPGKKLSLLLESRIVHEETKGEWLKQHGMHSEHLGLWEQELISLMNDKQTDLKSENVVASRSFFSLIPGLFLRKIAETYCKIPRSFHEGQHYKKRREQQRPARIEHKTHTVTNFRHTLL